MYYKFKLPFAFILSLFLLASCQSDTDSLTVEDTVDNFGESRGGPRGGGGGGGNGGDGPVTQLRHDIATDWMNLFIQLDRYATGMRPNATARAIAYIGLAAYETALPGMRDYKSNQDHLLGLILQRPDNERDIKYELALNAAYADVIDHFLLHLPTNQRNQIETFEQSNFQSLSQQANNREIEASLEWGSYIAEEIIAYSVKQIQKQRPRFLNPNPSRMSLRVAMATGLILLMQNVHCSHTGNPFAHLLFHHRRQVQFHQPLIMRILEAIILSK